MPVVADVLSTPVLVLLVLGLLALVAVRAVRRWRRSMRVTDDAEYVATLATLSDGSVRRHFNAYTDVDWDAPEFAVTANDPRWVLPASDPVGGLRWYQAQPVQKQIEIGMWRQANLAKVALHFEGILVRGLTLYAMGVPNGSPEFRYCLHESIEECNHSLMFQELVNRIGVDVPGMSWWLRRLALVMPVAVASLPNTFFFGVLSGEVPFDHLQAEVLRDADSAHPLVRHVIAIHVAEEARHISFAHEFLRKRVPHLLWISRFLLSLFVPIVMRVLGQAMVVPSRRLFRTYGAPRSVRRELRFAAPESRRTVHHMFADVRMLCHELGLMNPVARLLWRLCRIGGRPSRYRGEPQRTHLPAAVGGG